MQEYLAAEKIVETCFNDILNKDSRDKYILRYEHSMLQWLNDLFGKQPLSQEISEYIQIMIVKKDNASKQELSKRLSEHLSYFVEKDFLLKYETYEKAPLEKIYMIFQSYWHVLLMIGQQRNYLASGIISSKIVTYFNSISKGGYDTYGIHISNQIIENFQIMFLANISEDNIVNTVFKGCRISNDSIIFKTLKNINFINNDIYNLDLFESDMTNCKFENSRIYNLEIYGTSLTNVHFKDCLISSAKVIVGKSQKVKGLTFSNTTFSNESYTEISSIYKTAKFKNCRIRFSENEYRTI